MNFENERTYFTVDQVANYIGVSTGLIRKLAHSRELRCCKIGRCLRFDKADIDMWLEYHKRGVKYRV